MDVKLIKPFMIGTMIDHRFNTQDGKPKRIIQTISYPFDENGYKKINIRTTPGDATSLSTVHLGDIKDLKIAKKLFVHFAAASGYGSFPNDMLRYNNCQVDSLSNQVFSDNFNSRLGIYQLPNNTDIYIVQVSNRAFPIWTGNRWASFGWTLRHIRTERLEMGT